MISLLKEKSMKYTTSLILIVATLVWIAPLYAQDITGKIQGHILDEEGNAVPFATVMITGPDLQGARTALSSSNGLFVIPHLPVGTYTVKISHVSFQVVTYEEVIVRLGKTTTMPEIRLTGAVHELPPVLVEEKRILVDMTTTTIGANLIPEEFDQLPIQRDYRELPALLPLANTSSYNDDVNYGGATGLENKYFIDGVDVTDPYRGTTGMRLPYNFVREVEVKAGSYEAEYRSSLGGILNVITHSGRNEVHGQVFGFYANNRFAGEQRTGAFEPSTGDFSQYDLGFSVGGPIAKDKLWFYAAYNPTVEQEDVEIPDQGFYNDKNVVHIFAGKLTWRAAQRVNVGFSVFGDPGNHDAVGVFFGNTGVPVGFENPDPYLARLETGGVAGSLYADWLVSDRLFFETIISLNTRKDVLQAQTERGKNDLFFMDNETGIWSGGYPTPTDDFSMQGNAYLAGTLLLGNHAIKTGIEYREIRTDLDEEWRSLERTNDTLFTSIVFDLEGTVGNRIPSAFVQDSWQVFSRLRLNAGVRWDGQYLIDSNGDVAQKITDQYQPRVGFVLQPTASGKQKLFGSFARFYQDMSTSLSALKHVEGAVIEFVDYDHDPRLDPSGGAGFYDAAEIQSEVEGLKGQHYDEFTLGYEIQIGNTFKTGVTGVYRTLREGIEDAFVESVGDFLYGNPGRGLLSDYPEMRREYRGLVLSLERTGAQRLNFLASYVLSENEGNYPGLYNSDFDYSFPNVNGSYDFLGGTVDGDGLLPNDRTHVVKFYGSYRMRFGLTVGSSFFWGSGTPRSIFERSAGGFRVFSQTRGTDGRTPSIWDLNFRFAYDLARWNETRWKPRLLLDIFHLGSERQPVNFDQTKTLSPTDPSPTFGWATRYQPPTAMRLGLEVGF